MQNDPTSPVYGPTRVLGVMSGSSLDGLDLALCRFGLPEGDGPVPWTVERTRSVPYPAALQHRLIAAMEGPALELARLHRDLGIAIGEACRELIGTERIDLIASHGHTLFHRPNEGLTHQIGCGAHIAAIAGVPTACDFRTTDVALGGQGAPLVPIGERLFSATATTFLNLGGIANVSFHRASGVLGYDVCICNQALNALANEAGQAYDADGALARSGQVHPQLLEALNALPFHRQAPPRSLGREWFDEQVKPLIMDDRIALSDRMRTVVEHIAQQIGQELQQGSGEVMITGGGYHNGFLLERIAAASSLPIANVDTAVVDFKEAIVFAYLGWLRLQKRPNALASVTGARRDSIGGALYG